MMQTLHTLIHFKVKKSNIKYPLENLKDNLTDMEMNMESLTKKENELRALAENGDYWDILELADFLYDGKRYEEAKECYLKIAGSDDLSGDANSHLFQMLLDMGEYEEALMRLSVIP